MDYQIYLAGGMEGLSFEVQNAWRLKLKQDIIQHCKDNNKRHLPIIVNPCDFYNFESVAYRNDREVMEFDLHKVRTSQLIIVNFCFKPVSIGTAMELAVAREHRIPIIGITQEGINLHPWQVECCTRLCESYDELINHIKDFYLV